MKKKNIIEITIKSVDDKSGDIDLDICLQKLSCLKKILKQTVKKISSEKFIKLKITKASKNSPLTAGIAIECKEPLHEEMILSKIEKDLKIIRKGKINKSDLEYNDIQDYKHLTKISNEKNNRHEVSLSFPNKAKIIFDEVFAKNIDELLKEDHKCISSYEGELEQINLHNGINYFCIYPYNLLPQKIKCRFPEKLRDIAIDGIGRKVCITGEAIYTKNQNFPHLIEVKEIDVYSPETDLPDWDDLLGIAPDATDKLLSEDFVRKLRNEW